MHHHLDIKIPTDPKAAPCAVCEVLVCLIDDALQNNATQVHCQLATITLTLLHIRGLLKCY